ncbi:MAG: hypothetical protein AB7V27_05330 [Candidatus Binatia bacterium]
MLLSERLFDQQWEQGGVRVRTGCTEDSREPIVECCAPIRQMRGSQDREPSSAGAPDGVDGDSTDCDERCPRTRFEQVLGRAESQSDQRGAGEENHCRRDRKGALRGEGIQPPTQRFNTRANLCQARN